MSRRRPMSDLLALRNALGRVPPGYGDRHVRMVSSRNRRDPSAQPSSGKDRSYKPMVKSSGRQRESDGVVVLEIAVNNAAGGKGPDFGHAGRGGKREGMTGTAPSNYPEGRHMAPARQVHASLSRFPLPTLVNGPGSYALTWGRDWATADRFKAAGTPRRGSTFDFENYRPKEGLTAAEATAVPAYPATGREDGGAPHRR
jgi:hypothetical protein